MWYGVVAWRLRASSLARGTVAGVLLLFGGIGVQPADATCVEADLSCIERAWDQRDLCLATCRHREVDTQRLDRCRRDCLRRRREWTACCDQSDDCGETCRF